MRTAPRALLLILGLAVLAGCGGGADITEPTTGTLEVTTTSSGVESDADGYTLQVDGEAARPIGSAEMLRLTEVTSGAHTLRLGGLASNCSVGGENPRTANIAAGQTATSAFAITCKATSGTLWIDATTSGPSPDPNGYVLRLNGAERGGLGINGGIVVRELTAGSHLAELIGVVDNCQVQGINPRTVTIMGGETTTEAFAVTCVELPPGAVEQVSGDNQSGRPGEELTQPLVVRVLGVGGDPAPEVAVTWVVSAGGGRVAAENTTTDAQGRTSTRWTLGPSTGTNKVVAIVLGVGAVEFTATVAGDTGFDIKLRFLASLTSSQRQAFADAAARWEAVIVADVPNDPRFAAAGECGETSPEIDETIDDLLILVTVGEIDGPGGTLAVAGACTIRERDGLPSLGLMQLDVADLESGEAGGSLTDVILHEMGHTLGIGRSVWNDHGLLSGVGGNDPHFTGSRAITAFNAVGGSTYILGQKVPVENSGGPGTAGGHWRDAVFGNELMTGFISPTNLLSVVTIASLADLGYSVDMAQADPYTLLAALKAAARGPSLPLGDDQLRGPIRVVDPKGRVVRVIPR